MDRRSCYLLLGAGCAIAQASSNPSWQGCLEDAAKKLPYCDTSRSIEGRVDDLVSRLSLEEVIAAISPQPQLGGLCGTHTAGKPSIGLPGYFWLVEANTAVATNCFDKERCATTFVGPLGMGASFNRTNWHLKGTVIATEQRAFRNAHVARKSGKTDLVGLTAFGPNINIVRDPRFGRNSELPGEDPYLNGHYAKEMVQGMQEEDATGHPKVIAYLKHFTAYSRETDRMQSDANISMHDLHETYLAQYKIAFMEGNASGAMCSYNAENGRPSCTNSYLLNDIVRGAWGRTDAHITTDCGVLRNTVGPPANAKLPEIASAWVINNGTDLAMGDTIWTYSLQKAVRKGLVNESTVRQAARRSYKVLFRAGIFDPEAQVEWNRITPDVINSTEHQQISYEAALQSFVLLKNDGVLPLKKGSKVAVVGPMGVNHNLLSDYAGDQFCFDGPTYDCITTIADAITAANHGGVTTQTTGVAVNSQETSDITNALAMVQAADVVVLALGVDRTQEHEGIDREDIALPGMQEPFALKVLSLGKPTVLVLANGGTMAIDNLLSGSKTPGAIVEAFNPAFQAMALARTLFGEENRWGKLPVTMYPHSFQTENPLTNYDMSKAPGRTYRYYTGKPLFPFGHGLSYTEFSFSCGWGAEVPPYKISCELINQGKVVGDEVMMVFHSASDAVRSKANHPVPKRSLIHFERFTVYPGARAEVSFTITKEDLLLINENGVPTLYPGSHSIILSRGHGVEETSVVTIPSNTVVI